MGRLIEEARTFIRFNTVVHSGNEEMANYLLEGMKARGLKATLQHVSHSIDGLSKRQFNVIGILGDPLVDRKTKKGLLLASHLDTCSPGRPELWNVTDTNPFELLSADGKYYGLGTADAKLDFLCKLTAIERCRDLKLRAPVYLVGFAAKEFGMMGAAYLLKSLALNPRYTVVGQPSELKLVSRSKSLMLFNVSIGSATVERDARGFNRRISLDVLGVGAHEAYPERGHDALAAMFELLQEAQENGFEFRFTRIEGGDSIGRIPDRARCEFCLTSHQHEDFKRFAQQQVDRADPKRQYEFTFGGLGEAGVRFFPEDVFRLLLDLRGLVRDFGLVLRKVQDQEFYPPYSTVVRTRLTQLPGRLVFSFEIRGLPQLDSALVEQELRDQVQKIALTYPGLNILLGRERIVPALNVQDSPLMQISQNLLKDAGLDPGVTSSSISSESALFAEAGFDALGFGPGHSVGNSHSPNEHNFGEQMESAVRFYQSLIERVCT